MRPKLTVGNWKMNGDLAGNAARYAALSAGVAGLAPGRLGVVVPYPYLATARDALRGTGVLWGAQDVSAHAAGAYTGEVSAAMLAEFGCAWTLAGHSERRQYHGERDEVVAAKAKAALGAGLVPIVCVGETLAERDAGVTADVVSRQLDAVRVALGAGLARIVLAYEPVWAIGTGRSATPAEAQSVHATLRARLEAAGAGAVPILYGGSVKASNAGALAAMPDIDGALVGGASLDAVELLAIAHA